jgi:hypothetical protein
VLQTNNLYRATIKGGIKPNERFEAGNINCRGQINVNALRVADGVGTAFSDNPRKCALFFVSAER